jgi:hypothetical protein
MTITTSLQSGSWFGSPKISLSHVSSFYSEESFHINIATASLAALGPGKILRRAKRQLWNAKP